MLDKSTLLIVVNDPNLCETMAKVFTEDGYEVITTTTGQSAIVLAQETNFNAAMIEFQLPDLDGISVLRELKKNFPAMVCCIITDQASQQDAIESLQEGASDYFIKPPVLKKILHHLQAALESIQTQKSLMLSEEKLRRNFETQTVINTILQLSLLSISLKQILEQTLDLIMSIPWLAFENSGAIFLASPYNSDLTMTAQSGIPAELLDKWTFTKLGRCLCGMAATTEKIQYNGCIDERHNINYSGIVPPRHYCVPITLADQLLGVISINVKEGRKREQEEESFLASIANTLAGIIDRKHIEAANHALELQLRQSQKLEAMGTLAGGIAHDFNNILSAIFGFVELAKDDINSPEQLQDDINEIRHGALRAKDLVKQMLTFSRQSKDELRPVMVRPIIKEAIKMMKASMPPSIEVRSAIMPQDECVLTNPSHIHQVVMNLCTNAFHAMKDGGGILEISLENLDFKETAIPDSTGKWLKSGKYVKLMVKDTGHGMDQATMNRIFEPYFTTKRAEDGTGLGLSVVYGIVKEMGGEITANSEPQKGSKFEIFMPSCDPETVELSPATAEGQLMGTEKILFVDDEQFLSILAHRLLGRYGYSVTTHTNSLEALRDFKSRPDSFDLVITDQLMPKMTGISLTKKVLQLRPDIPVIIITGNADAISKGAAEKAGAQEMITKPLESAELAAAVRRVLDK